MIETILNWIDWEAVIWCTPLLIGLCVYELFQTNKEGTKEDR